MVSKLDHNLSIPRLCRTDTANSETAEEGDSVLYKGRRKEEREKKKGGGQGKEPSEMRSNEFFIVFHGELLLLC